MSESKKCPFCWEEILSTAIKCKHCWEFLEKQVEKKYIPFNYSFSSEFWRKEFIDFVGKRYFLKNINLNTRTWTKVSWGWSYGNGHVSSVNTTVHSLFDVSFNLELDEKIKINKEYINLCYNFFNLNYKTNVFLLIFIFIFSFFIILFYIENVPEALRGYYFILDLIISLLISIIIYRIGWNNFIVEKNQILEKIKNYKILWENITLEQNNNLKFNAEYKTIKKLVLICTILIILLFTFPNLFEKNINLEKWDNRISVNLESTSSNSFWLRMKKDNEFKERTKSIDIKSMSTADKVTNMLLPYSPSEVKSIHFKYNWKDKYLIMPNLNLSDTIKKELKDKINKITELEGNKNIYIPANNNVIKNFENNIKWLHDVLGNSVQKDFEGSEIEGFEKYMSGVLSAR